MCPTVCTWELIIIKKSAIVGRSYREYQRRWQIWEYQNYFRSPVCSSCKRQMWSGAISVRVFQEKWGRTSVMHMALVFRKYWFKLEQVQKRKGNLKKRLKHCGLFNLQEKPQETQNKTIQQPQNNNKKPHVDRMALSKIQQEKRAT